MHTDELGTECIGVKFQRSGNPYTMGAVVITNHSGCQSKKTNARLEVRRVPQALGIVAQFLK